MHHLQEARRESSVAARPRAASWRGLSATVASVLAADQATKALIVRLLPEGDSYEVVRRVLYISHVRNTGAAFSLFRGSSTFLTVAALAGVAFLAAYIARRPPRRLAYAAALVAGGASGNLVDRFTRGTVVDFVDLRGRWPAFNVADSAITIGVILLMLLSGRRADAA